MLTLPRGLTTKKLSILTILLLTGCTCPTMTQTSPKIALGFIGGTLMGTTRPSLVSLGACIFAAPLIHVFTKKYTPQQKSMLYKKFVNAAFLTGYGSLYGLCLGGFLFPSAEHATMAKMVALTSLCTVIGINCCGILVACSLAVLLIHIVEMIVKIAQERRRRAPPQVKLALF